MNDSIDQEVWEAEGFWAIKNSKKVFDDGKIVQYECELQGKVSKDYIEEYLSNQEGKQIELIVNED
jgi:hypothetical protein